MKIINKGRGTGKTWDLIVEASKNPFGVILVFNNSNKRFLEERIKLMYCMEYIVRTPIVKTVEELKARGANRKLKDMDFYIDELDMFLSNHLNVKVNTATMTGEVEDHINKVSLPKQTSVKEIGAKLEPDISRAIEELKKLNEQLNKMKSKKKIKADKYRIINELLDTKVGFSLMYNVHKLLKIEPIFDYSEKISIVYITENNYADDRNLEIVDNLDDLISQFKLAGLGGTHVTKVNF